jgi:homopolymeric O-antigen transport system permease protein
MTIGVPSLSATAPAVVLTPESGLRHPLQLGRDMLRDVARSRELAWRLLVRDLRAQYRQSIFGIAWAFLPPIVMAVAFTLARKTQILVVGETSLPYPVYVLFSTILWQTFVEALNGPLVALSQAKPMLSRINFPREALILAKLGELIVNFAIKLLPLAAVLIWFAIPVHWTVVLAPAGLVALVLLGTLFGLVLAPLGLLLHDVPKGIPLVTAAWFLLTPVVYPVPAGGLFATVVKLNPVTPLLVSTRELVTSGMLSDPRAFVAVGLLTLLGLAAAWVVYRLAMPFALERISA